MLELRAAVLGALVQWSGSLYDPVHHIESARLYGNIDYYAYYFVDLLIGEPPQRVSVILDTGSGVAAFPCASCSHCGKHIDPNFDIAKSTTAKWTSCGHGCRGTCKNNHCAYHQGYQEGSSISGYWFKDWVRLGDAIQRNPRVYTSIGCHYNENNLFYTQKANGILGIRGSGNLLHALFQDKAHIESMVFSICLAEWGGRLVVGGHNKSYHQGPIVWTSITPGSYGVTLQSMQVAGSGRQITGFGHCMIDSGTTYTYMGREPYNALKGGIEDYCRKNSGCGAQKQGGKCWNVPQGPAGLSKFPSVSVSFAGAATTWTSSGYLYRKGTSNQWCYAFEDDGPRAPTVLGASWMLYQEIIFDLRVNKVGIVKAACPEYKKRPEHSTKNLEPPTVPPVKSPPLPRPVPTPSTAANAPAPKAPVLPSLSEKLKNGLPGMLGAQGLANLMDKFRTSTKPPAGQPAPPPTRAPAPPPAPPPVPPTQLPAKPLPPPAPPVVNVVQPASPVAKAPVATPMPAPTPAVNSVATEMPEPDTRPEGMPLMGYARLAAAVFFALLTFGVFACCTRRFTRSKEHGHSQIGQSESSGMPPQIVGSTEEHEGSSGFVITEGDGDDDEEGLGLVQNVDNGNAGIDPLGSPVHAGSSEVRSWPEPRRGLAAGDGPLE